MNKWGIAMIGMLIGVIAADSNSQPKALDELPARVDHLVYGTPDLDTGIEQLAELLGVRATPEVSTQAGERAMP